MRSRLADRAQWRCWVALRQGTLVGHVWVSLIEKIPNPGAEPERHGYVTNMYVRRDDRGGTGTALLAQAIAWCDRQKLDEVILWPTPRSRRLYRRYGFRPGRHLMSRR
jgi:GNAT superfamily N-acetyltransferase